MSESTSTGPIEVRHVEARVHGRHLVRVPAGAPKGVLVGFHGFGETAQANMAELRRLPGLDDWLLASVQALHPFYRRSGEIVASWMTSLDRELAIRNNIDYVDSVLQGLRSEAPDGPLVVLGFSQGTAMAWRAAAFTSVRVDGVIALGSDVPPELGDRDRVDFDRALVGRGRRDEWYSAEKLAADLALLEKLGLAPTVYEFDGGHEWTDGFRSEVLSFLTGLAGEAG